MEKLILNKALTEEDIRFTYNNYLVRNVKLKSGDRNKLIIRIIIGIIATIAAFSCLGFTTAPDIWEYTFAFILFTLGFYNIIYFIGKLYLLMFNKKVRKRFLSGKSQVCKEGIYLEDGYIVIPAVRRYYIHEIRKIVLNNGYCIIFINDGTYFFFLPKEDMDYDKLHSLFTEVEITVDDAAEGIIERHIHKLKKSNLRGKVQVIAAAVSIYLSFAIIHKIINDTHLPANMAYRQWVNYLQMSFYLLTSVLLLAFVILTDSNYRKLKNRGYKRKLIPGIFIIFTYILFVIVAVIAIPLYVVLISDTSDKEVYKNPNNTIIVRHVADYYEGQYSYSLWKEKGHMYRILLKDIDEIGALDNTTEYPLDVKEIEEMNRRYQKQIEEKSKKENEIKIEKQDKSYSNKSEQPDYDNTQNNEESIKALLKYLKASDAEIEYGAKGDQSAIIYEDEKIAKGIIYDNRSPNGKADIFVLYEFPKDENGEFSYSNGKILNTYAVNIKTGKVIPSGKKTWGDMESNEFIKETEK